MKLIDGIKIEGQPVYIPDCSREALPEFFKSRGYQTGVEIGVYKGAFTEKFCKAGFTMYAIDPWMVYNTEVDQDRHDYLYRFTKKVLAPYTNCTIIRKTSMDAMGSFRNDSLDFVYIDGDHRFPYIAQDIYGWWQKIKKDGVISGHDYSDTDSNRKSQMIHVKPILDAFVRISGIKNYYAFGLLKREERKSNADKHWSWMIIKQ